MGVGYITDQLGYVAYARFLLNGIKAHGMNNERAEYRQFNNQHEQKGVESLGSDVVRTGLANPGIDRPE